MNEAKKKHGCVKWILIILGVPCLIGVLSGIFGGNSTEKNDSDSRDSQQVITDKSVQKENNPVTWDINVEKDEMTDSKNIWAAIKSDNYIEQEFPYQGLTYSTITVRYMKKYGYDVLLTIDRGQIVGNSINGSNYVTVQFDGGTPKKYTFNDPEDGSTETVFLNNQKDFMERCKKSKEIKIEMPLYQAGRPVFVFHVDKPLEWPQ